jgi:hypothetical protein
METFQKMILYSSIIILIIVLIIIGMVLNTSRYGGTWPPVVPDCPDYWILDGSGNNAKCINEKDLGSCPPQNGSKHLIMDFNVQPFTGSDGICHKYKWAKKCNVSWDGITYGVENPCQSNS